MKRMLMICMIAAITMSIVLVGCGANNSSNGSTSNTGSKSTGSTGSTNSGSETKKDNEPAKPAAPVKLSVVVSGAAIPTPDKDPILQQLNKDLNIDLELEVIAADYTQQLNVKIAGGTPPDLFKVTKSQLTAYAKQGLLLDLGPYMDQMPNVQKAYTEELLNEGRVDGQLYSLVQRPSIPMTSLWIRKDWLDHLGLPVPKTLDDLKEVAIAFTENDPDNNGKKDTVGLTGTQLRTFEPIFAAFGVALPGNYTIKDNEVVYATTDPAMKDALAYINELVAAKTVDPEIMANKGLDDQQKVFQGKAGIIYHQWSEMAKSNYVEQYKSINPNAEWIQVEALQGPGGKYTGVWSVGTNVIGPFWLAMPKSLEKTPEKLNKILEYLNYITGDGEGQNLVSYGIEGTHYNVENNEIVALPAMDDLGYSIAHQLTGRDVLKYLSVKFAAQKEYIDFALNQPRIHVYDSFVPIPEGLVGDDKKTFETEELTKFIYGKRPLAEYDQFVDTLNKTFQLPKYIESAEQALKDAQFIK